mmetsp:Transcript_256/g.649  ORF Transcript_256/g.649 Transcript_256/m.649 type:complete len:96 (+) Transcript_256:2173-2460(+)
MLCFSPKDLWISSYDPAKCYLLRSRQVSENYSSSVASSVALLNGDLRTACLKKDSREDFLPNSSVQRNVLDRVASVLLPPCSVIGLSRQELLRNG